MTVKFTYTVEDDQVLEEAAKLLGLQAPGVQTLINTFTSIQQELQVKEDPVNITQVLDSLREFRKVLVLLDIRAAEVANIVKSYSALQLVDPLPIEAAAPPEEEPAS